MSTPSQRKTADAPKHRSKGSGRRKVAKVLLISSLVLTLIVAISVVVLYRQLNGNLTVEDVSGALGEDRPDDGPRDAINVLVMASDTRDGAGNAIDGEGGAEASDTTILFHLSADRQRAYGVSIPRDSIVDRPACGESDEIPAAPDAMWNAAYTVGGQACTIRQFEETTGIYVDHYVVVDFNGFKDMVNAIDGVEVCIPSDINDPAHGIQIPAGTRTLRDSEALDYVRARYTVGDGSDLGRIARQQAFVASMTNKVISAGTLARLDRLVGFLNAATSSLTVDPGLKNVAKIGQLGMGFQDIGLDKIRFLTVPNAYYPSDSAFSGRVYWTKQAESLWRALRLDEEVPAQLLGDAVSADDVPGTKKKPPFGTPKQPKPSEEKTAEAESQGLCA